MVNRPTSEDDRKVVGLTACPASFT